MYDDKFSVVRRTISKLYTPVNYSNKLRAYITIYLQDSHC